MKRSWDYSYAYPRSVKYLSIRPRSVQEMREYLEKKGVDQEVVQKVVDTLLNDRFLDDSEFTRWWIRGRQARGKAVFVIRRELTFKGVDSEIVDEELKKNAADDLEVAREVVEKNQKKYAKYSGREYFEKMGAFLARRGFSYDVIRKVVTSS